MEKIDLKLIYQDKTVDSKVLNVYRKLKKYKEASARATWLEKRKKAWDLVGNNELWDDDEKDAIRKAGQIPFVINKCNKGVQGSSAIVTDSKPEVKFHPVGAGDLYVAELLRRGFDHVWSKNDGNDATYEVVEESKVGGMGFFDVKHNKNKGLFGRIEFGESPPDTIYFDPESRKRDYSDTDIIKAQLRTKSYIRDNYEDITDDDLSFVSSLSGDDEGKSSGLTAGDNYAEGENDDIPDINAEPKTVWEIEAWLLETVKEYRIVTMDDKTGKVSTTSWDKKPKEEDIPKGAKVIPLTIEKRKQCIIVGKKLIESKMNPYGVDADGDPIIPIIGLKSQKTLTAYAASPTFFALDINKEKCKRRQQFIAAAAQEINSPIIESIGTKWIGEPGTPLSRVQMPKNDPREPHRMKGGGTNMMAFVTLENQADDDINDQYDLQDVMRGKAPKGQENSSGRMILALQDLGGMMSKPFLRALESTLVRLAKVVVIIQLRNWPRYMWERLLEPAEMMTWTPDGNQEPDEKIRAKWIAALDKISPQDTSKESSLSLLDFDIRLTAGSSMPTNRMAKMQIAMELSGGVPLYDREAALEYIDDPNKDKIVERMKKDEIAAMEAEAMKGK